MKILILTTSDPYKSAGIVALDLYKGLSNIEGNEVKVLVKNWNRFQDEDIIPIQTKIEHYWQTAQYRYMQLMRIFGIKSKSRQTDPDYFVSDCNLTRAYFSTQKILQKAQFKPDAILVLFMYKFLTFKNLYELNQITKAPLLLYMMDMAPMTGGCHYAWDCKGYINMCGKCPAMFSAVENDQSRANWKFKKNSIEKTDLTVIAGTEHQFRQLQKSSIFAQKRKAKILLSINPEIFKPGNQSTARKLLNLPLNKKTLFFGAVSPGSKRKGFKELVQALHLLKTIDPDIEVHLAIAGKADERLIDNLPFGYTLLGYLDHVRLAKAFQAADLFLCPSIEDSGPMMINQSIMSGTPVVAFEMGVALDLVISGETGYRAKLNDTVDMANGIKKVLQLNENEFSVMRKKCRDLGMHTGRPDVQANMFLDVLNKICNHGNSIS